MDSKTISSDKSSISSKESRDSNVEPKNSCLSAQLALSHLNCEDENVEKRGKFGKEINSLVRDNDLNDKIAKNEKAKIESAVEAEYK